MVVIMVGIQVGADHGFIFISQQALGKFHANGVRLLRRDLALRERLYHVIALDTIRLSIPALSIRHILVGMAQAAQVCRFKAGLLGFIAVECIANGGIQYRLFFVQHIVDGYIQSEI